MTSTLNKPIRVVLADDHLLMLQGLVSLLKEEEGIEVVHTATDGQDVINYLRYHKDEVDVIVLDIEMPELTGIQTARKLKEQYPQVKVLMLTSHNQEGFITHALQTGALGYMLKDNGHSELVEAIQTVNKGQKYLGKEVTETLVERTINPSPDKPKLTRREAQVLTLVGKSLRASEIAAQLGIKESTVVTHRNNLILKLGVRGVSGLVRYAVENGY